MTNIPVTSNYVALKEADAAGKFYKVLEGSSGSGKTFSILQYLIEKALTGKRRITAYRDDQSTCRDSIVTDFMIVMGEQFGIWKQANWNGSNFQYRFPNGSVFQFRGANSPAKLHGPRREISWGNEVIEISWEAHRQISLRTSEEMIYDFNPSLNYHWVFDKIMPRADCAHIHSTFRDNPMLPEKARIEIEAMEPTPENIAAGTADEWGWSVYGLGRRGRREGAIFKVWDITDDWPEPMMCQRHGFGLDYGFSLDPTALIECALFQDRLYLRERLYEKELIAQANPLDPETPSIEGRLRELGIPEHARIHGESARPEINRALQKSGFKIIPTVKSASSILAGIDRLRTYPIFIHRNSQNAQREFESYTWDKNASGEFLDRPVDKDNHLIDAARYWALGELNPQRSLHSPKGKAKSRRAKSNLRTWR